MKIIEPTTPIEVSQLVVLLYGQPSVGKTTIAFSAENVLLLDFDKRTYTAPNRQHVAEINSYADLQEIMQQPELIRPYRTIVIDTVGRMLDMIAQHIIQSSPKSRTALGGLSLNGYGDLGSVFQNFLKFLRSQGKDIVMLGHEKTETDTSDTRRYTVDTLGKTALAEIVKSADFIGRMYFNADGKKRFLNFNASDSQLGKNSSDVGEILLPHWSALENFLGDFIEEQKERLGKAMEEEITAQDIVANWKEALLSIANVSALNDAFKEIKALERPLYEQLRRPLADCAKDLGAEYDVQVNEFIGRMASTTEKPKAKATSKRKEVVS